MIMIIKLIFYFSFKIKNKMGNEAMQIRIEKQEKWVNEQYQNMGGYNGKWSNIISLNGNKYSNRQIKSKLRQEYHNKSEPNSYILDSDWEKIKNITNWKRF